MSAKNPLRYVFPVIHHLTDVLTLQQANIALNLGADGVFLISHHDDNAALIPLAQTLQETRPGKLIGINLLGVPAFDAYFTGKCAQVDMVWSDYPGISSQGANNAAHLVSAEREHPESPAYFASVAFKYQSAEPDPRKAAQLAHSFGFIPTTSGTATGSAPGTDKIRIMSEAIDGADLAVASGMTPENVGDYLPYVTHYLVSTGVSSDAYRFDEARLKAFIDKVHGHIPLADRFRMQSDEYIQFERIPNPPHHRPDICAFLLLDRLCPMPAGQDMVTHAEHDLICLNVDLDELAKRATDTDIQTLVRCGVMLSADGLEMFV